MPMLTTDTASSSFRRSGLIKSKSMEELKEAIDDGMIVAMWGTALNVFAVVQDTSLKEHRLEMWKVTP